MREENGIVEINKAIEKLSRHHIRHIKAYDPNEVAERTKLKAVHCSNINLKSPVRLLGFECSKKACV